MILSLSIKNIVLIEALEINFQDGLCVLTGETGAGKSILLDALGLVLGKRAEARLVRHGQAQGSAIAEFDISGNIGLQKLLADNEIEASCNLLIRRVIKFDGKSKAFINDCPVGQGLLQNIAESLVEIHGQHDQRGLVSPTKHRSLLDEYAQVSTLLGDMKETFANWQNTSKEYQALLESLAKAREDEEYLRHIYQELKDLAPIVGEEEKLADKRTKLMNGQKILEALNDALKVLTEKNSIVSSISSAQRILDRSIAQSGDMFNDAIEALDRVGIEAAEAISAIETTAANVELDDNILDDTEERLFALRAAGRKYNYAVDELSNYADNVALQITQLETQDKKLDELKQLASQHRGKYIELASELRQIRQKSATDIEQKIMDELIPLKMGNSRFKVDVVALEENDWNAKGMDRVEFLVSTNAGSPFDRLGKIASGGELSRLMLALKVVLSDVKSVPTLIFDEIDTGIGGAVADSVGKRLARLGQNVQVLCVTHQPQVASYGNHHLRIEKSENNGSTTTSVAMIDGSHRKEEIARMLAGEQITEEARAAAMKLMDA